MANNPEYPGIFELRADSGDICTRQVFTRPQLEQLRASINDALANDDVARRRQ
nr:MAG TPA: hypothetical protein [Caudoviricetes sp.]